MRPFRRYQEVPVGYMPEFVSQKLGKSKYMSVCYDYGHGKFSEMDTCITNTLAQDLGLSLRVGHVLSFQSEQTMQNDPLGQAGTNRPSKRITGASVDSSFPSSIFAI